MQAIYRRLNSRSSLVRTLTWGLVLTVIIVMVIFNIFSYLLTVQQIEADLRSKAADSVQELAGVLATSLWNFDQKNLEQTVQVYASFEDVVLIRVIDSKSKTLYDYDKTDTTTPFITRSGFIFYNNQQIGQVEIAFSSRAIQIAQRDRVVSTLLLTLFMTSAIVVTNQVLLRRFLRRPLTEIIAVLNSIASGNYEHRLAPFHKSDLDRIVDSINEMAGQIAVAVHNARLIAEQQQIVEELQALDKLKSQFLANMSHELRTPLNSILNFTEFVASGIFGPVNERQVDALNKSVASGEHLLALINDILDLSKIESGMMELFIEEVDLHVLVSDVTSLTEGLLKDNSIQFICDLADSLPTMTGDRRRIQQILLNLISNAIKFTPRGSVKLSAALEGHHVHFSVRDTGLGIKPEDQELIFQSFRQTRQGLQKGTGTGLGLPISKHLAEAHGGRLWLESVIGVGSCFHVLLPVEHEAIPVKQ